MSDFLTKLADKTLGLIPVAQPIIAPMFAPDTLNDNLQSPVQSNRSQDALDKTQESQTQENQLAFSKSNLTAEARFPEMKTDHNNSTLKPVSQSVNSGNLPESKNSKANISDRSEHKESSTDVFISEQNQKNSLENSFNARKDRSGPSILDKLNTTKAQKDRSGSSVLDELNTTKAQKDRSGPSVLDELNNTLRSIRSVSEAQQNEVSTSMNYAHRRFHSQNAVTPASSSSTPTIQVTIGRIEVRAISSPAPVTPAQRSRMPSPTLSLDEYLKQRNGGQR